jgi:hypothetical protein
MLTLLTHYLLALAAAAVFWPVATLIFAGGTYGNPKGIAFVRNIGSVLAKLPPTALFACHDGKITVTVVDRSRAAEKTLTAWEMRGYLTKVSLLTWNGPPKSGARVRVRLGIELILRSLAFVAFVICPVGAAIWLAFTSDWLWICGAVAVTAGAVFSTLCGKTLILHPLRVFQWVSLLFWGSAAGRWIAEKLGFDWLYKSLNFLGSLSADWHDRIVPVTVTLTIIIVLATAALIWADES